MLKVRNVFDWLGDDIASYQPVIKLPTAQPGDHRGGIKKDENFLQKAGRNLRDSQRVLYDEKVS